MSKLIIVTGALGFIGANLAEALNKKGHTNLLLVDHLNNTDKWRNFGHLDFEDYLDREAFMRLLSSGRFSSQVEAVFHLGACSSTTETDTNFLMENNYRYTKTLAQWTAERKIPMILASSAATYGNGSSGYSDDPALVSQYVPLNMYGMSKHLFDKWALRRVLYEENLVGLKFFNVYGPHEDHKGNMRSVVYKAFYQILERGYVELFKSYHPNYQDGRQLRDFVYVDDAVKVMLYFFEHPEKHGLYNCGSGIARSWNDLAEAVFAAMGKKVDIRYIEMPENLRGKYQYYTCADMRRLKEAGYTEPFTSLEDGVKDYVQNYLAVQAGVE
ncbi:MAG: ADP-glyceromanno-heptose 6-epimerase [Candidatus Bruticola sp.]